MAVRFVPGIQTLVIIGVLLTSLLGVPVETLQCGFCAPEECSTEGLDDCAGSKVYDECGCCQRCAPVENEKCGGSLIDYHGECDTGLVCEISPSYGQPITGSEIGVCKKCANQFDGCNVIDEECVCGKACSKDFFKYSSNASCEKARSLTSERSLPEPVVPVDFLEKWNEMVGCFALPYHGVSLTLVCILQIYPTHLTVTNPKEVVYVGLILCTLTANFLMRSYW